MTSTLPHFWQLASSSKSDRLRSAYGLIESLKAAQLTCAQAQVILPAHFDDGLVNERPEHVTDDDVQEAEAELAESGNSDIAYSIKRLIKGQASHRQSSRLGFSVALCEVLARIDFVASRQILVLVLAYSTPNGKIRGQEERDLVYARLFGIHALVRSGMLFNDRLSREVDYRRAVNVLFSVSKGKPWLRETASFAIVQAIESLAKANVSWKDECMRWMIEKVCRDQSVTADNVAIFMALNANANLGVVTKSDRLSHFASQEVLSQPNLPILARILRDAQVHDELQDGESALMKTAAASGSLQAHFLWNMILEMYSENADGVNPQVPFAELFRVLVDENFFSATSSHQKKSWGLQILEKAALTIRTDLISSIFTPNLMRTLMNQLGGKDRLLHKSAQKACLGLQNAAKERRRIAYTVIMHLTSGTGNIRFDSMTNTKTVETILRYLSAAEVRTFADHLITASCQDVSEGIRKALFDQLLVLVRNTNISTDQSCIENILTFFAAHGLFSVLSANKKAKATCLSLVPSPAFTSAAKASCRSRFLSCLSDLHTVPSSEGKAQDWITKGHEIVRALEGDTKHLQCIAKSSSAVLSGANEGIKAIAASAKRAKETHAAARMEAYDALLTASALYVQFAQVDEQEAQEMIEPLVECADHLFSPETAQTEQPGPMELFVECLSNALHPASAFLRGVATAAFDAFGDQMTHASMHLLLEQLGFDQAADREGVEEDEEMARDEESESIADSMSDTSATSLDSDDAASDEEVDEDFAAKVREALQSGGVADENDDEDVEDGDEKDEDEESEEGHSVAQNSDLDDDQMMLIDDKLADIFRQKFSARKQEDEAKKEEIAYHIRILDLLEHFARQHSESPLCIDMVLPLFSITMEKDKEMEGLRQRASAVLQKSLLKGKRWPTNVSDKDVRDGLDAVHKMACTNLNNAQVSLANAANVYLTRSCLHDVVEVPKSVCQIYAATLNDFVERKANNLKPAFLLDAFTRFPLLGLALRKELFLCAAGPQESVQHSFRQVQVMEMLRTILAQMVAQSQTAEQRSAVEDVLRQVATLSMKRAKEDKFRVKEILKLALHFVRLTKKLSEQEKDDDLMSTIWPHEELLSVKEALETTNVLPNAASLQNLMKQLIAMTHVKKQHSLTVGDNRPTAPKRSSEEMPSTASKKKKTKKGQ